MNDSRVTLFYAPQSRASVTLGLLEELDVPYDLQVLSLKTNQQRGEKYLAVNPMGKVPAILHNGALITEQPAVFVYLADLYAEKKLAPALGDPLRGPYLRWMFFYGSCFEPAVVDRSAQRPPLDQSTCPYSDFDTMFNTLETQLKKGPYLLGDRFTAADILWGQSLAWTTGFKLVPATPTVMAYIERVTSRPALQRAGQKNQQYAAEEAEKLAAKG
jgi:glutathione S-transferase